MVLQSVADRRGLPDDHRPVLAWVRLLVGFVTEVLQLHVEVVGAEDVAEAQEGGVGIGVAAGVGEVADLPVTASGQTDEAIGVGTQRLDGDCRRALALGVGEMGAGDEAAEVGIALTGLGEEDQVVGVVGGVGGWGRRAGPAGRCARAGRVCVCGGEEALHPDLDAEHRLDPPLGTRLGKADGAVQAVVVGEGQAPAAPVRPPGPPTPRCGCPRPGTRSSSGRAGARRGERRRRWVRDRLRGARLATSPRASWARGCSRTCGSHRRRAASRVPAWPPCSSSSPEFGAARDCRM